MLDSSSLQECLPPYSPPILPFMSFRQLFQMCKLHSLFSTEKHPIAIVLLNKCRYCYIVIGVSIVCMSVYHTHTWCPRRLEKALDSLELELQLAFNQDGVLRIEPTSSRKVDRTLNS